MPIHCFCIAWLNVPWGQNASFRTVQICLWRARNGWCLHKKLEVGIPFKGLLEFFLIFINTNRHTQFTNSWHSAPESTGIGFISTGGDTLLDHLVLRSQTSSLTSIGLLASPAMNSYENIGGNMSPRLLPNSCACLLYLGNTQKQRSVHVSWIPRLVFRRNF